MNLVTKGVSFGALTALPNGSVDTSAVVGVDPDFGNKTVFAQGCVPLAARIHRHCDEPTSRHAGD